MKKIAQVVKIENNIAFIKVARASACGDKCQTCGSHCTDEGHILKTKDNNYNLGQLLVLETADNNILFYSLVAYGIPLLVMIISSLLAYKFINFGDKEITSSIIGVLSLIFSFFILRWIDNNYFKKSEIIKEIVPYRGE